MTAAHDPVNHPVHYTSSPAHCSGCGKTIECIDVTRWHGFNIGNVIKYLWREGLKGASIQDLEKSAWYLADEITKRKSADPRPAPPVLLPAAQTDAVGPPAGRPGGLETSSDGGEAGPSVPE